MSEKKKENNKKIVNGAYVPFYTLVPRTRCTPLSQRCEPLSGAIGKLAQSNSGLVPTSCRWPTSRRIHRPRPGSSRGRDSKVEEYRTWHLTVLTRRWVERGLTHACTCLLLSFSSLNVSELASTVSCPKKHKQGMRPGLSGFFVSFLSSSPLPANPRVLPEKQRNPSVSTPSWYHNPRTVLSRRKYDIRPPRQFSKQRTR